MPHEPSYQNLDGLGRTVTSGHLPEPDIEWQVATRPVAGGGAIGGGYTMELKPLHFDLAPSEIVMTEGGTSG
jgi:hypothetical protein